jgi:hypothetical protein
MVIYPCVLSVSMSPHRLLVKETLTKRKATQHGCLPSFLGDGDNRAAKAEEESLVPSQLYIAYRTNQGRTPFHLYSLSPDTPIHKFQLSAGATPSLVSVAGNISVTLSSVSSAVSPMVCTPHPSPPANICCFFTIFVGTVTRGSRSVNQSSPLVCKPSCL